MNKSESSTSNIEHYAELQRQGKLQLAEKGYRGILASKPEDFNANQLLATVLQQKGDLAEAENHYNLALKCIDSDPSLHSNYGSLLQALGKLEDSIEHYSKAIQIKPDHFDALRNRALLYEQMGKHRSAISDLEACVRIDPASYNIWVHKGHCESLCTQYERASISLSAAIAIDPLQHRAFSKYGEVLTKKGSFLEGRLLLQKSLELNPFYLPAFFTLGENYFLAHDFPNAIDATEQLLSIAGNSDLAAVEKISDWSDRKNLSDPEAALRVDTIATSAFCLKAKALTQLGRRDEAITAATEALKISPNNNEALNIRSQQYISLKNFEAAEADLEHLIELGAHTDSPLLLGDYLITLRGAFNWDRAQEVQAEIEQKLQSGTYCIMPFHLLSATDSAALQQTCARFQKAILENIHSVSKKEKAFPGKIRSAGEPDRLKVAYISPDFRHHPVAFLTRGIFEHHDRSRFEVFCISLRSAPDDKESLEIQQACDYWIDASTENAEDLINRLREHKIDIAVDLAGFTSGARTTLFAKRVAPVQINFLGYPGTMGKSFMDYIIADSYTIPENVQTKYSEKVIYLDPCFQPNDSRRENNIVKLSRAALSLPEQATILCCNNRAEKISLGIFEAWTEILRRAPSTCLWILGIGDSQAELLRSKLVACNIDPTRLVASPRVPYSQNLSRMKNADLMLDTFPFNGGTSTSEALWVGIPVLTLSGEAFASRMSGSLISACKLEGLIAKSIEEYTDIALKLVAEPEKLSAMKRHLKTSRNTLPLFDTSFYTRRLEAAYEKAARRSRAGFNPQHIYS